MIERLFSSRVIWPALTLVLLLLLNLVMHPSFFAIAYKNGHFFGSLIDIAVRAAPLIIVSLGMTLVIATGGVDLSVGAVAALAPAVAVTCLTAGMSLAVSIATATGAVLLVGIWNGALVASLGLQPIVATLVAMVAGRGIAQLLVDGQIASLSNPTLLYLGSGHLLGFPVVIWVALGLFAVAALLCRKTASGLFIEALGSSPDASYYIGLNAQAAKILVYAICATAAGLAGLSVSANIRAVDVNNLGLFLELDAILAVVIGGTRLTGGRFSLLGSVLGALIIQTVATTINTRGVAIEAMLMVKAFVVIGVCLFQSEKFRGLVRVSRARPQLKEGAAA